MTRNKKKLRRLARQTAGRTLRTLSLPALVLAGMLAVPAAANAAGYQDAADWTGEVTLGQNDDVTLSTPWIETDRANITATKITLDGGSLTLTDDARLINYKRKDNTSGTEGAVFIMNDGTLTLTGKAGNTSHSSLDMTSATINGGTIEITGSTGSDWNHAAYVGGYQGLTVNGGVIALNTNSELFGGGDVGAQFLGGTVKLLGNKDATEFDGGAAHIMFGGTGANTIGGTAALTVGNGTEKAWGVMTTGQAVNMTGGALTVKDKANLLLQPNVTNGANIVYDGSSTTDTGAFNLSGGTLTVDAGGTLSAPYTQINQTDGTLTVNGLLRTEQLNPADFNYLRSGYTLSGGKLVISGDASEIANTKGGRNGDMQVGSLTIAGGEVSIASTGGVPTTGWDNGARLGGFGVANGSVTTVSGGKVTLGDSGVLFAGVEAWGGATGGLNISGNAAIVMDGTDSVLYASSTDDKTGWVPLTIADNAVITVNANKSGYILSRATAMTGGTLDVQGALTVAGKSEKGKAVATGITNPSAIDFVQGGTFNLSGGSITVADAGTLDFATGNVTLTVSDNGAITAGTLTVDAAAAPGLSTQKLNLAGGTVKVKNLKVGAVADSLSMTGGNLVVAESFQNGGTGSVDVTGGVLSVDKSQVYDAANTGTLLKTGVSTIDVSGNGVVEVRNGGTMESADAKKFHDSLVGADGLWNGITVTGITATGLELADGSRKDVVSAADAKIMSADQLAQTSVATDMTGINTANLAPVAGQVALVGSGQLNGDVTLTAADSTIVGQGESSSLVIGAGAHQTNVEVASGASLNLGVASTQGGGTLNGSISNDSGNVATVNVANGAFAVNGDVNLVEGGGNGALNLNQAAVLNVSGDVNAAQMNLAGASLEAEQVVADELTLNDGSALTARNLTLQNNGAVGAGSIVQTDVLEASGGLLTVGNDQGKGVVVAGTAQLNGASVFLDPAWRDGSTITDASQMVVGGSQVDGLYTVGRNSHLTWGSTDQSWLTGAASRAGIAWGENATTAAVGVYSPQTLTAQGGLTVNGALAALGNTGMQDHAAPGSAYFGAHSLLVVNSGNLNGQAAITSTGGTATVADTAQLLLTDAVAGQTYTILSGFNDPASSIADGGWSGGNLFQTSSSMLSLNLRDNLAVDGSVSVSAARNNAIDVLPGISSGMAGLVDSLYAQGLNGVNAPNAGVRFVSRATDNGFMPASESARALESAAQTALAGGAPSVAFDAVTAATGAVGERTSISVPSFSRQAGLSAGDNGHSFGVWATPLFRSTEIDGQKAGAFKYGVDSDVWGGAIGADVTNGSFRLGVALNVGGGDAKSSGDLYKTKNDFDFWGATAYAGYRLDNLGAGSLGLSADLGYTAVSSDIKQDLNLNLGMGGQLQSKVDADVYSVGMKAEYVIPTAFMDVAPSVGMRYNAYRQGRYNVDGAYGAVFNMDKSEMDTWTFPIGVKFSRDFHTTGWSVRPELNLAFIPAAGDTELDSKARIPGLGIAPAALTGHVFDDWTGEAGVGLSVAKENISFGLNYDFQGSENRKSHSVFGTLRIAF